MCHFKDFSSHEVAEVAGGFDYNTYRVGKDSDENQYENASLFQWN